MSRNTEISGLPSGASLLDHSKWIQGWEDYTLWTNNDINDYTHKHRKSPDGRWTTDDDYQCRVPSPFATGPRPGYWYDGKAEDKKLRVVAYDVRIPGGGQVSVSHVERSRTPGAGVDSRPCSPIMSGLPRPPVPKLPWRQRWEKRWKKRWDKVPGSRKELKSLYKRKKYDLKNWKPFRGTSNFKVNHNKNKTGDAAKRNHPIPRRRSFLRKHVKHIYDAEWSAVGRRYATRTDYSWNGEEWVQVPWPWLRIVNRTSWSSERSVYSWKPGRNRTSLPVAERNRKSATSEERNRSSLRNEGRNRSSLPNQERNRTSLPGERSRKSVPIEGMHRTSLLSEESNRASHLSGDTVKIDTTRTRWFADTTRYRKRDKLQRRLLARVPFEWSGAREILRDVVVWAGSVLLAYLGEELAEEGPHGILHGPDGVSFTTYGPIKKPVELRRNWWTRLEMLRGQNKRGS